MQAEVRFREKAASDEFQAELMRSMMERPGTGVPENVSLLRDQKLAAVHKKAAHDFIFGGPRLFPRNQAECETMKRMMMAKLMKFIPGVGEKQRNRLSQIMGDIEEEHGRLLARRRKEQARGLWRKAACAVWLFLAFRASVERSFAPGGVAAKRAQEDFESCAKLQRGS